MGRSGEQPVRALADDGRAAASAPPAPPSGALADVVAFRAALDTADFTTASVRTALEADNVLESKAHEIAVHERRLAAAAPALAALIRLFAIDVPVAVDDVDRALPGIGADGLERLGLAAEEDGMLRGSVHLVPHDELLIASDRAGIGGPDHVAGVHYPSATLSNLTIRRPVGSALDVATGCGIQAIQAARHCGRVVGTDVNERALAFAEFNAVLNGVDNVEFRSGNFFEPAGDERFELVVCNPPYVISPESTLVFRDSGLPGDTVSAELVAALPSYLEDGGFGTIMISWIAGEDTTLRPRAWLDGRGCDAWILHSATDAPLRTAAAWTAAAGTEPEGYTERLDAWLEYYARLGIEAIGYGAVVVHKRAGGRNWIRTAELPSNRLNPASDHLQQLFAAQELLASAPGGELLDRRLALVAPALVDRTARVEAGGWKETSAAVRLERGLSFGVKLDRYGAALVTALDGAAPMREHIAPLAVELGVPETELTAFAVQLLRHLVEYGFAMPA